jgi:lipid II:glycine glycyltransferase (peptidoglycan interpeptide bridge formation enzyme)
MFYGFWGIRAKLRKSAETKTFSADAEKTAKREAYTLFH